MKRFDQLIQGRQKDVMVECPTGEWARYADVGAVEAVDATKQARELCERIDSLHTIHDDDQRKAIYDECLQALQHALAAKDAELAAKEARVVELERWFHGYRTPEHSMKAMLGELTQMREILRKIARWCPQDASCDGCALAHKYAHAALERKDIA